MRRISANGFAPARAGFGWESGGRRGAFEGEGHQFAAGFLRAVGPRHQHAPEMHAVGGGDQAAVGGDCAVLFGENMRRGQVFAVHFLIRADLLDHEHGGAGAVDGVQLAGGQFVKGFYLVVHTFLHFFRRPFSQRYAASQ